VLLPLLSVELLHELAQKTGEFVSELTLLGVARSAVFPVLNVVFTVVIFVRRGLSQQPSLDGSRTGLSAQNRALLEESLADSYALAVPVVHEIC
jgi:hypothetical protein